MQKMNDMVLGIDTSNYTTSAALTDEKRQVIRDERMLLRVKQGERGLRQSNALFQHHENLPVLLQPLLCEFRGCIRAISISSRPRPEEGSYMPVFLAGFQAGQMLADALGVPLMEFSHQEGHIASGAFQSGLSVKQPFLAWHLSGGTCELLFVSESGQMRRIGGSLDISFGQLIDRMGVAMGLRFPCGRQLDQMALSAAAALKSTKAAQSEASLLDGRSVKPIAIKDLHFNISGIETQALRLLEREEISREMLTLQIFREIAACVGRVTVEAAQATGARQVLFTGGVVASGFLQAHLPQVCEGARRQGPSGRKKERLSLEKEPLPKLCFGRPEYCSDNAVGVSFLGGDRLWA